MGELDFWPVSQLELECFLSYLWMYDRAHLIIPEIVVIIEYQSSSHFNPDYFTLCCCAG